MAKFWDNGVTVLRVWCQWDFTPPHVFADVSPGQSLFRTTGELDLVFADRLCELAATTSHRGMALEVTLFSQERNPNLSEQSLANGTTNVSHLLLPYRNVLLQIWNENNVGTERLYHLVKGVDADRLVTNSPGILRRAWRRAPQSPDGRLDSPHGPPAAR